MGKGWQVLLVGSLVLGASLSGRGILGFNESVAIAADANQSESRGNRIRLNGQTCGATGLCGLRMENAPRCGIHGARKKFRDSITRYAK
ncbi:MAG: hypothetical protein HC799_09575 [Limnothrix sp. RL_2_0]|nr:hypothetical protein [Limnothrix sp. RL_2_0]